MNLKAKSTFLNIFLSSFIVQIIMITGSLLFSRLYSPNSFKDLGLITSISSIVSLVAAWRFDYISFSKYSFEKNSCISIALILMLLTHIVLAIFLIQFNKEINFYNISVVLIFFSCFSTSIFYIGTQMLIANGSYSYFSKIRVVQALIQIFLGLIFFYLRVSQGLILTFVISQLIVGLIIYIENFNKLRLVSFKKLVPIISDNISYAIKNTLLVILQYSTPFAPMLIGGYFFLNADLGAYFLFSSAIAAPCSILRRSLLNYFHGEITNRTIGRDYLFLLVSKVRKNTNILIFIILSMVILLFGLSIFSKNVVIIIFGKQWSNYSIYFLPTIIFFILDMILQPFTTLLPMWGFQRYSYVLESLRFLATYIIPYLCLILFRIDFLQFLFLFFTINVVVYTINLIITVSLALNTDIK